ncbi:hypothetical protein D3C87_1092770 [compost metagenome]
MRRTDAVFHLHRFQHHQLRTGLNRLPGLDQHTDNAAVHRRGQAALMAVAGFDGADRIVRLDTAQLAFPLQVQRIVLANRTQRTTNALVLDDKCFAGQSGVVGSIQRQGAILPLATQMQGDFRRQPRTQTAIE